VMLRISEFMLVTDLAKIIKWGCMDIAFKVLVVSTVIAVTGFFFLAITGLQAKQGITDYQVGQLIKANELHAKLLSDLSNKLYVHFNW
jgi:hypothetical protein